eukprot:CAMPEP_0114244728 /NCGR_PEP_ID=MMETSP0058-20121206/11501_1 /TAXON_ID=36894 /ORGANISM="Pyramimonas parkeae, CCMP726" /LENGTH=660 /DNA_ID=CAMNT_0001357701 /DNA_START=349 /DNA_END=2328 /DNA_ORIENTATION=-
MAGVLEPLVHVPDPRMKQLLVHRLCALWAAEVFEDDDGKLCQVATSLRRARQLKCTLCKDPGGVIGCQVEKCQSKYHVMCARQVGCHMVGDPEYKLYCPNHMPATVAQEDSSPFIDAPDTQTPPRSPAHPPAQPHDMPPRQQCQELDPDIPWKIDDNGEDEQEARSDREHQPRCEYCHQSSQEDIRLGPLERLYDPELQQTLIVHKLCALWTPEVYEGGNDEMYKLASSVKRGKRLRCKYCKKLGGTIGCQVSSCLSTFHYACACKHGCRMDEVVDPKTNNLQYKLHCPKHLHSNTSTPCSAPSRQPTCSTTPDCALENLQPRTPSDALEIQPPRQVLDPNMSWKSYDTDLDTEEDEEECRNDSAHQHGVEDGSHLAESVIVNHVMEDSEMLTKIEEENETVEESIITKQNVDMEEDSETMTQIEAEHDTVERSILTEQNVAINVEDDSGTMTKIERNNDAVGRRTFIEPSTMIHIEQDSDITTQIEEGCHVTMEGSGLTGQTSVIRAEEDSEIETQIEGEYKAVAKSIRTEQSVEICLEEVSETMTQIEGDYDTRSILVERPTADHHEQDSDIRTQIVEDHDTMEGSGLTEQTAVIRAEEDSEIQTQIEGEHNMVERSIPTEHNVAMHAEEDSDTMTQIEGDCDMMEGSGLTKQTTVIR